MTNREGFVLASKALEGNPYDGHTLSTTMDQVVAMTDVEPARVYVDLGYRGHDYAHKERVFIARQRRGLTPTIKRELRRRSAIEPMIGHMKADGRLGRNHLLGAAGDAINALLVAAGHNLRLILNWLRLFIAWLMAALISSFAQSDTSQVARNPAPASCRRIIQGRLHRLRTSGTVLAGLALEMMQVPDKPDLSALEDSHGELA